MPKQSSAIAQIINLPAVDAAIKSHAALQSSLKNLIQLLTWQDFKLFVDLIFSQGGWRKISSQEENQTVDLGFIQPLTNEKAVVRIKAHATQDDLDDYLAKPSEGKAFYVYHSAVNSPDAKGLEASLIDATTLAQIAVRVGLAEWLIEKDLRA